MRLAPTLRAALKEAREAGLPIARVRIDVDTGEIVIDCHPEPARRMLPPSEIDFSK